MQRVYALLALMLWGAAPNAGELSLVTDGSGKDGHALCHYRFEGPIAKGDAAKLKAIPGHLNGETICFDSAGGSFSEGLQIFDVLWSNNTRATVLPGDRCEGACALAFLGGSMLPGRGPRQVPMRELHIDGKLGFSFPELSVDFARNYSARDVERGFQNAMRSAQAIHDIRQTQAHGHRAMTEFLYDRILRSSQSGTFYVDRVGQAVLAEVQVFGVAYPQKFSKRHALSVCDLAYLQTQPVGREGVSVEQHVRKVQRKASAQLNGVPRLNRVRASAHAPARGTMVRGYPAVRPKHELICEVNQQLDQSLDAYTDVRNFRETLSHRYFDVKFFAAPSGPRGAVQGKDASSPPAPTFRTKIPFYAIYGADTRLEDLPRQISVETARKKQVPRLNFVQTEERPRIRFTRLEGIDLVGADLSDRGYRPVGLSACERICREARGCQAYTWERDKELCFLKSGDDRRKINSSMVSGVRR